MNWVEQIVATHLISTRPTGYTVNSLAIKGIVHALVRSKGVCPCSHKEWDENTPEKDKLCPCITFRATGVCHCGLFQKQINPNRE